MMKDHSGNIKQYIVSHEAWYASSRNTCQNEVMFGYYSPNGGTSGEMAMRWHNLCASHQRTPRLEVYNDGWHALATFKDVLDALAEVDDVDITPKQFCTILDECGFVDATARKYEDSYPDER